MILALTTGPADAQAVTSEVPPAKASASEESIPDRTERRSQSGSTGLEEIVVTARRREENLQDVPIAISALSGETLAARGLFKTEDLMGSIPNLQIGSFVGSATPNITLRAIGVGNEFNATANSPIGVYIDEDYQAFRPAHGQQLFDLERVEVVKGPQGTLYGRNTTGGAINFISKIPALADSTGYATARYGNYDAWAVEGAAEATLVTDVLGVRIAGNSAKADGYIKNRSPAGVNVTDQDFGGTDSNSVRVTLRYKPTSALDFVLKGYWAKSDPIGVPPIVRSLLPSGADVSGYSRAGLDRDEAQTNTLGRFLTKTEGTTLRGTIDLGAATVTSVTGYNKSLYDTDTDCDGGINLICRNDFRSAAEQFNQDLRSNFDFGRVNLILGAYYGWQDIETHNAENYFGFIDDFFPGLPFNPPIGSAEALGSGLFNPAAPITGIYARQHFDQVSRSKAVYGEATYEVTDALSLTLGARYTKDSIEYKDAVTTLQDANGVVRASVIPFSFPFDPTVAPFADSQSSTSFTGRAIVDYKIWPDAHIFASFGKGYRSGTYNGFAYQSVEQIYFVKPEEVDAIELGIKSRFAADRIQFNASVFNYEYKNQQLQEIVGSIGFLRALDGRVRGAEIEVTAQATPDLRVSASFGALDTKYSTNSKSILSGQQVGENEWPFAPAYTFNMNADWTFAQTSLGRFRVVPEAQYSASYFYDVFNAQSLKQDAYWLLNGRLTYEADAGYSLSVWGKNLFDKYYEPWGANTADFGVNYYIRAMARTYGVEASIRF
jgi:iron complex outermembrane receptor protein